MYPYSVTCTHTNTRTKMHVRHYTYQAHLFIKIIRIQKHQLGCYGNNYENYNNNTNSIKYKNNRLNLVLNHLHSIRNTWFILIWILILILLLLSLLLLPLLLLLLMLFLLLLFLFLMLFNTIVIIIIIISLLLNMYYC